MSNVPHIDDHPRFKRLGDYLAAKAPPGKLPGRQHIDPIELGDLLPHLMLVDVVPQGEGEPRYRIRLIGTDLVAAHGSDPTGKFADEALSGGQVTDIMLGYAEIVRSRQPQFRSGKVASPGREHIPYRRFAFPLARDGENVDMLIFVFVRDS